MERAPAADATADSLDERLREASVGAGALGVGADLAGVGGIGRVRSEGDRATVPVTLPVPAALVRRSIEAEVTDAAEAAGLGSADVEWAPAPVDPGVRVDLLPDVSAVIAVASGKGGVGKSTVAVNLAAALADAGAAVGLLDADVYGPNAPALLGLSAATPETTADATIVPRKAHGVAVMSMAFVVDEDDPIIWRGALVDDLIGQFLGDVEWGRLDYLVVDLPPGTGDAQLSLVDRLPLAGAVVVTTPQAVAVDDARRGLEAFARYDVPILGIVENMSGLVCAECGTAHDVFGAGGADDLADEFSVPVLGRIPLDPDVGRLETTGTPGSRGLSLPVIGRVGLPRTREERARDGRRPPVACRPDGGEARTALRLAATRTAARANLAAREFP